MAGVHALTPEKRIRVEESMHAQGARIVQRQPRLASAVVGLAAVLAGCGLLPAAAAAPLSYSNQTSIAVDLVLNGSRVVTINPGQAGAVPVSVLPPLPWTVAAQTSSGRVLATLVVKAGDVDQSGTSQKGDAVRVDLSCGRLEIWSGPPLSGPAPGPGSPGDCEP